MKRKENVSQQKCKELGLDDKITRAWLRGFKTFFMLNSAEHEMSTAKKTQMPKW